MIFRGLFFVFVLVPVMIVIIPLQALINALKLPFWNVLPRLFHRLGCFFLGLRVEVIGQPATGRATLLVANHISWTDIVAVGSVADVTFVAKREVGDWPFVGMMARLQRPFLLTAPAAPMPAAPPEQWARIWRVAMPCCCLLKANPISAPMCCHSARPRWAQRNMP
ncbi:1-acyl-sn-glycerol-3-phosphate acyltransferase [Devosia sp. A8/3-2]|nr:1-acyl-sn-glycerol-3-phosphate acyltransferase [Devosia sp. A8/3-2]